MHLDLTRYHHVRRSTVAVLAAGLALLMAGCSTPANSPSAPPSTMSSGSSATSGNPTALAAQACADANAAALLQLKWLATPDAVTRTDYTNYDALVTDGERQAVNAANADEKWRTLARVVAAAGGSSQGDSNTGSLWKTVLGECAAQGVPAGTPTPTISVAAHVTCDDLARQITTVFALRHHSASDGEVDYWPHVTVHNNSSVDVTVTLAGTATTTASPILGAGSQIWGGTTADQITVSAGKQGTYELGNATGDLLSTYPGQKIKSISVTATATTTDHEVADCQLHNARLVKS